MKVFIGYDSTSPISYNVCKFSIKKNTSKDIEVVPLIQQDLRDQGIYYRPIDEKGSTEFTFTRFLIPFISGYQGWAIFCDSDFLWINDIQKLIEKADDQYAVMVVKHEYVPSVDIKFLGNIQYQYPRKNWSSMVLWNCSHEKNKIITKELINTASGQFLHRFMWLNNSDIGSIDKTWNWLVNWYQEPKDGHPNALHFTEGGPWIDNYKDCQYSNIWEEYNEQYKLSH